MAAAAAIAMANQQMAQSMQAKNPLSNHQSNVPFSVQSNTNSVGAPAAETNGTNVPSASQPLNPMQQLSFPFPHQNPFAAALLSGLFSGSPALLNPAPGPAAPSINAASSTAPQHIVNNGDALSDNPVTETKARKRSRKKKVATETVQPVAQNVPHAAVAAAAAQVFAAHGAFPPVSSGAALPNTVFSHMQNWTPEQLEQHVQLLRDTGQQIPQPVAILLAEARKKEEKRTAKRAANRKSACSSRARKKALVEEMTKANAWLRRQAMILALLPDLVIAITVDGKITFCSAQVERVLRHKISHLIGANFEDIIMPSSREKLGRLVQELVAAEHAATIDAAVAAPDNSSSAKPARAIRVASSDPENSSGNDANRVTDCSFPLAVVNCANEPNSAEDNSDLSASNGGGGKAEETTTAQRGGSPKSYSQVKSDASCGSMPNQRAQAQSSSDDSFASSNLLKANEALDRNVRFHNEKLASEGKAGKIKPAHKDDVTGAAVTANNASARLSSLQVKLVPQEEEKTIKRKTSRYDSMEEQYSSSSSELMLDGPEKKRSRRNGLQNASDDSGYRESDQSVEDTSDDSSEIRNGPRIKPLAPACNICLIRDDLTTIWCEVTSSIRTRSLKDESSDETMGPLEAKAVSSNATTSADASKWGDEDQGEVKELLLCLRPIRDGEESVDESLRFVPPNNLEISESNLLDSGDPSSASERNRPPKKRPIVSEPSSSSLSNDASKKRRVDGVETEKSAVESLMLMGNHA
jgi:PAS domain-containing protein